MPEVRLEISITKSGAPADSVVLSDSGGTFGMRRQDTLEVVIADGVAMVQDAGDLKRWAYTYADGVAGVTYEWWAECVFGDDTYHFEKTATAPSAFEDDLVITVGDADAIIESFVMAADRVVWDALTDGDKAIFLRTAQEEINAGQWRGRKVASSQTFAFPRYDDDACTYIGGGDADAPPAPVKEAIALIAWSKVDKASAWERVDLRTGGGVAAHGVSGVSESFTTPTGRSAAELRLMVCAAAWSRLAPLWRRGGILV